MTNNCEHIQPCSECKKNLCSYCIEPCDGCDIEACENCYTAHLIKCVGCSILLCPTHILFVKDKNDTLCPTCRMKGELNDQNT